MVDSIKHGLSVDFRKQQRKLEAYEAAFAEIAKALVRPDEQAEVRTILRRHQMMAVAYVETSARLKAVEDALLALEVGACVVDETEKCHAHTDVAWCRAAEIVAMVRPKTRESANPVTTREA